MEYIQIRNTIVKSYWLYIKPFAELLRQKRVKLLFIIRMSLIITTSAIINKLMTKPNMFPPKIICNINHGIIITRYIILCKIIRYKFYRFTIVFLWSSPYKKAIASLVRYKKCTYNTKKIPHRSEGFLYYRIPKIHIPRAPPQKWMRKLTTEMARPTRHHVPCGT